MKLELTKLSFLYSSKQIYIKIESAIQIDECLIFMQGLSCAWNRHFSYWVELNKRVMQVTQKATNSTSCLIGVISIFRDCQGDNVRMVENLVHALLVRT